MSDIRQNAPITLAQIRQELKDFGFGDDNQDIDGGDFVEYGGKLFESLSMELTEERAEAPVHKYCAALRWIVEFCQEHHEWWGEGSPDEGAEYEWLEHASKLLNDYNPTMAERWVKLQTQHEDWCKEKPGNNLDFGEWLDQDHPEERETLTWIANWDSRPVDGRLKADPRRATSFSVMDFSDGSIAIKRGFGDDEERRTWMVAS